MNEPERSVMVDTIHVREVELAAAEHDFRVRVDPAAVPDGTVLVWLHGGAFMFGDLDMPEADETAKQLADRGTTVFSLDYTLAPTDAIAALPPLGPVDGMPSPMRWPLPSAQTGRVRRTGRVAPGRRRVQLGS